jgi:GxxExxY protein
MPESDLLYHDLTRTIIGAFFEAHKELGSGFLEAICKNGVAVLLRRAGLRVEREVPFEIIFHGESLGTYRADMIVDRKVVVEVKTGRLIDPVHIAQVRNYLRVSKLKVGLLLNFGPSADFKRLVATADGDVSVTA